jgi:ribose/xylose/arabinose/galactoside ABC-type transport system permease subunit
VNPDADTWLNTLTASLGPGGKWMIVPPGVWIMILLALLVAGVLRYTRLGRHTFAIGSNEQAAVLCGVRVGRVKVLLYTICAAFAGLAGVMQFSRLTLGDPTAAVGMELNVIAAVVIGGGSLAGGEGSVPGTLVGALIMTVIDAGCSHMSLANWVQEIATGVMIVLAVALDRFRRQRTKWGQTLT